MGKNRSCFRVRSIRSDNLVDGKRKIEVHAEGTIVGEDTGICDYGLHVQFMAYTNPVCNLPAYQVLWALLADLDCKTGGY